MGKDEAKRGVSGVALDGVKVLLAAFPQDTDDFVLIKSTIIIQNDDECCIARAARIAVAGPFAANSRYTLLHVI